MRLDTPPDTTVGVRVLDHFDQVLALEGVHEGTSFLVV